MNGAGLLDQVCTDGQWVDDQTCDDPDVCVNNDVQAGTTSCGLNGTGLLDQVCTDGQWEDTETCVDPDICVNSETQTVACGINGASTVDQTCTNGQWVDADTCNDPDVWVNSETQTVRGINGASTVDPTCTDGQWVDEQTCDDPDVCVNDDVQLGTTACGADGSYVQSCTDGQWVDSGTCYETESGCNYTINLEDLAYLSGFSFDGWGSSYVEILINDNLSTATKLYFDGSVPSDPPVVVSESDTAVYGQSFTFSIAGNTLSGSDIFLFSYRLEVASDAVPDLMSYEVIDHEGNVFDSGANPELY